MAEEEQQPSAKVLAQRRKRAKKKEDDARLGIVNRPMPISRGLAEILDRLMANHKISEWQEVVSSLLLYADSADHATASNMLATRPATPFVITERMSQAFDAAIKSELEEDSLEV